MAINKNLMLRIDIKRIKERLVEAGFKVGQQPDHVIMGGDYINSLSKKDKEIIKIIGSEETAIVEEVDALWN